MRKLPILLTTIFIALCTGCGNSSNSPTTQNPTTSITQETKPQTTEEVTTEETTTEETTTEEAVQHYVAGDTITIGDFEVTINSFEITDKVASSAYTSFNAKEGSKFIIADITIKNTGKSANTFISTYSIGNDNMSAKVIYDGEYEFNGTNLLGHSDDLHDRQLNPLESKTGILVFSVAQEAIDSSDPLVLRLTLKKQIFEYSIR